MRKNRRKVILFAIALIFALTSIGKIKVKAEELGDIPIVLYQSHVQEIGWQDWVSNGETSGTSGKALRLEGIKIKFDDSITHGDITYRTHVQNIGWQDWVSNGEMSGTSGKSLRLEAIEIKLNDELESKYDIYYRVHAQSYGWLDWAKNGESAGTVGYSKRLEAIEVVLVNKGEAAPGNTENPCYDRSKEKSITYETHVQNYGWKETSSNGMISGTVGEAKRLEAIKIKANNLGEGGITYRTHVQNIGWQDWVSDGAVSGTSGKSLRLEAIQIKLTGDIENNYDVYYRVHAETFGWLGWAKNGESAGTEGYSKRLEAIQIIFVPKGEEGPVSLGRAFGKNSTKYSNGIYLVGRDVPAGEYVVYSNNPKDTSYYFISSDSNQQEEIISEYIFGNSIITLNEGEYVQLENCYIIDEKAIPIINSSSEGTFRVGVDVFPGTYNIEAIDKEYIGIHFIGLEPRFIGGTYDTFDDPISISVNEGEYLKLYNCKIS